MKKSLLLARSNLRKTKGQATAIAVLILLAAVMLNLWLMLSLDYKQNFDRCHSRLNAEHVTLAVDENNSDMRDFLTHTLNGDTRAADFCFTPALHMVGSFDFNNGEINSELIFLEKQAALSRSIGKVEILEESGAKSGVYMPILYKSDRIAVGKTVDISIGSNKMSYTVCGFFNSVMAGSHNCSMCALILTEDKYEELKKSGYAPNATLCSVRLNNKADSETCETWLKNTVAARYPTAHTVSNSYALVSQSRYISQMICASILNAMAFLILLIALVVMSSNIMNYIQEHMKNLGVLKAVGYTSRQLTGALILQFSGVSLLFSAAGVGLSYCLFPQLNKMMISQTGIPYQVRFLPLPCGITLLLLEIAVIFTVWLSSRRIKKVEPIVALRQGMQTHTFRRSRVPLEKTNMPFILALAVKTTLSDAKRNITICITMFIVSLIMVFSGLMIENVIADMTPFLDLIVGETADSCINVEKNIEKNFLREMQTDPRVEKLYLYSSVSLRHVDGLELTAVVCDDFSKVNNPGVVFEGRFPRYDNEMALAAKYAGEQKLKIGDEITVTANGRKSAYIISGLTQITNNLGKDCLITRAGYERLGKLPNTSYYLNLTEETDIDNFHTEVKKRFGNDINAAINVEATINGASAVYISLMMILVIAILLLSIVVITFVLFLLIRTMLNHQKQDYGIQKALGFTTGQLILQTALSFMPTVILSTLTGMAVCSLIINPLTAFFLRSIGIVKCTFTVPLGLNILGGTGLILFTFAIACLLSLKIKKIAPKELLTGE